MALIEESNCFYGCDDKTCICRVCENLKVCENLCRRGTMVAYLNVNFCHTSDSHSGYKFEDWITKMIGI